MLKDDCAHKIFAKNTTLIHYSKQKSKNNYTLCLFILCLD